jgi:hypothetical protein
MSPFPRRGVLAAVGTGIAVTTTWFTLSAAGTPRTPSDVSPQIDVQSATIDQISPIDPRAVPQREVVLSIEVAEAPTCTSQTGYLSYGFLIDSDLDPATGPSADAFAGLGVDARMNATCDPATGAFAVPAGMTVTVTPTSNGGATVEIHTTVGSLPSVEFDWIAFAQKDSTFVRLPAAPEHGTWSTSERWSF